MKIADALGMSARTSKQVLENMVRAQRADWNFGAMILCYRGHEPVVMLTLPPNRELLLGVANLAARGYAADVMALTHDSYMIAGPADKAVDPRTGKPWGPNPSDGPGPMETYIEEFGYDGTVVDCLVTHVVNRAGDAALWPQPYAVEGREVKWLDLMPDDAQFAGGVPDALRKIMDQSTLNVMVPQVMPDWAVKLALSDPDRAQWSFDMVTSQFLEIELGDEVEFCLFARKGSPRDQVLRSKFPRSKVMDPGKEN